MHHIPFSKIKRTPQYKTQKALAEHYKSLFRTAVSELKCYRMMCDSMYNSLDEISTVTNDQITKKLADMAKERHNLDKLIHTRTLFPDKK